MGLAPGDLEDLVLGPGRSDVWVRSSRGLSVRGLIAGRWTGAVERGEEGAPLCCESVWLRRAGHGTGEVSTSGGVMWRGWALGAPFFGGRPRRLGGAATAGAVDGRSGIDGEFRVDEELALAVGAADAAS